MQKHCDKFREHGYELLESEFRGAIKKHRFIGKDGYLYFNTLSSLNEGKIPKTFATTNPFTIDNIKTWLLKNDIGYELLTSEYKGAEEKMLWKNTSNGLCYIASWKKVHYQKHPIDDATKHENRVNSLINKSRNNTLVTNEIINILSESFSDWRVNGDINTLYNGSGSNFPVISKEGYLSSTNIERLRLGKSPSLFRNAESDICTYNMYKLVENKSEYKIEPNQEFSSSLDYYCFSCKEHGEFYETLSNITKIDICCPRCEGYLQTKSSRETKEYYHWRKNVLNKSGHKCDCCKSKNNLVVHHLNSYDWFVEGRTDVNNGVTLCENCHTRGEYAFHKSYGAGNNTVEQYNEWLETIVKGGLQAQKI